MDLVTVYYMGMCTSVPLPVFDKKLHDGSIVWGTYGWTIVL